jgi:glycosyltransferase involved in cell wall biosynthesis
VTVWGIATIKDEGDIARGVVTHMADEVDRLLILDNGSTDGTRETLAELAKELPLTVIDDPEVGYYQSRRMSRLARMAAEMDDDPQDAVIVPFDADELFYARAGRLREVLPDLPYPIAHADLYHHLRTAVDEDNPDPFRSMVWRQDQPARLPKVAFRWQPGAVIHQGNHGVTLPSGERGGLRVMEVRHFPIRSAAQMLRRARNGAAAYAAAPDAPGGDHWRAWGRLTDQQLADAYREHWCYLDPTSVGLTHDIGLIRDPAPYMRWRTI